MNDDMEVHTMRQCATCKRGVQNQHSVLGMCPSCAEAELTRLRGIEAAVLAGCGSEEAARSLREAVAGTIIHRSWRDYFDAIADALEADA